MPAKISDPLHPKSSVMGTERIAVDQMAPAVVNDLVKTIATITHP